ncbi:MAG: hypothetical protein JOZ62_08175 [Acidobacteriaceae bacterium]|nr:hypothetical protein [Acidobacteriaceae bacterium]
MRSWLPLFLAALFAAPLGADTRKLTKTTINGQEYVSAFYTQGHKLRTEYSSQNPLHERVTIQDSDRNVTYLLDPESRKYVESGPQTSDLILSLAQWIARPPRIRESGKTVNVYYEVVDTGERQQFFGKTAKHLRVRTRQVAEPGACQGSYTAEKDGWYLPGSERPARRIFAAYLGFSIMPANQAFAYFDVVGSAYPCRDNIVIHGSPASPGLAVRETSRDVTVEVLEFSDAPLDSSLFQVPPGFQKVDALPGQRAMSWSERLEMEWAQLERAFESWFD